MRNALLSDTATHCNPHNIHLIPNAYKNQQGNRAAGASLAVPVCGEGVWQVSRTKPVKGWRQVQLCRPTAKWSMFRRALGN